MGKISAGAGISAAFGYLRPGWRGAWGILMISVWVAAIDQAIQTLRPDLSAVTALGELIAAFTTIAASGALYRLALQANHPGDNAYRAHEAGLQWGALEWRVLGANVIVGLILIGLFFVACFIWGIALAITLAGHASDLGNLNNSDPAVRNAAIGQVFFGGGLLVTVILVIPTLCALVYLAARLLAFAPMAADGGGLNLGKAWALTRGGVLAIIGALIVIGIVEVIAAGVSGGLAGLIGGAVGGGGSAAQLWGGIAGASVGAAISPPLLCGLQLYIYHTRSADPAVVEAFS